MYGSIRGGHTNYYMLIGCRLLGEVPMSYRAMKNGYVKQSTSEGVINELPPTRQLSRKGPA